MQRIHNWDVYLAMWATDLLGQPFVWGETDCASLVRAAMQVMYGEDRWPDTPRYTDAAGALRVSEEHGTVKDHVLALGATKHVITFTQAGDIVIAPKTAEEHFDATAIAIADKLLMTEEGRGVWTVPVWKAPEQGTAYRVPHGE
jgi:cell wall-associated NlpC family hydrolase